MNEKSRNPWTRGVEMTSPAGYISIDREGEEHCALMALPEYVDQVVTALNNHEAITMLREAVAQTKDEDPA